VWLEQALPGVADRAREWRHRKYSVIPCKCADCIAGPAGNVTISSHARYDAVARGKKW
jgi:hypothetical protein